MPRSDGTDEFRSPLGSTPYGSWGPSPESENPGQRRFLENSDREKDVRGFVSANLVAFYTVLCGLIALPFAFGYWCWPTFVGWKCSATMLWLCHTLQFSAMLTIFSNLIQYYIYLGKLGRTGSHLSRYGPTYCVSWASLLLMVYPTVFILKDMNIITPICQSKYGMTVIKGSTYLGLFLLTYSCAWVTEAIAKLQTAWRSEDEV